MADDVVIGSASVQIVGDYSGLEKSFSESQSLAQQAGQKIAAAFDSSAAGAAALTTAVSTVANTVEDLAAKSGLAGGELNLFRAALQGSLEAGVPVNAALQDMAASSTTLGTAVAAAAQGLQQEAAAAGEGVGANDALGDSFKRVRNDAEALEAAWEKAIAEDKKLADAAKKDAADFAHAWDEAIKENNARAKAEFEKFATSVQNFITHPLQAAGVAVKDFMLAVGPLGLVALGTVAAMAAIGKELFSLVEEFGKAAEATQNMADRLNLTWRETRDLEQMATIAGVSISGLQRASVRMAESLDETSEAGQKTAAVLRQIGVSGNDSGELLKSFLQRLSQIPDDTQRIELAFKVMGRGAQEMLPLIKNLDELKKAVHELGPAIDSELAKNLTASDDALDKLSLAVKNFEEELAARVAPAVTAVADALRNLIVQTSQLAIETVNSAKALVELIPAELLSNLAGFAGWLVKINALVNPFLSGIRLMVSGINEFNLVVSTITGKTVGLDNINKALADNLAKTHASTTATKEFHDVFKTGSTGVQKSIEDVLAAQDKLTANVKNARAAYEQLNEQYKSGAIVLGHGKVTLEDVARALANLRAAEAAASLTKVEHTKQVENFSKALRPAADNVAIFVKQLELMKSAHQKLIADAAEFSNTFVRAYTVAEVAAIKAAAAAFDLKKAFEALGDENAKFTGHAEKIAPLMDEIGKSIDAAKAKALDTDPWVKLEEALDKLGIKGEFYYSRLATEADKNYKIVAESADASYTEQALAALRAAEAEVRLAQYKNQISREEADKTLAQIKGDMDALDASSDKSAHTRARHEKTLGEEIRDINRKTFDSMERDLARSIVALKGFGDIWKTLWHKLAEDLLQIMLKQLFKPLEDAFGKVLGQIKIPGLGGGAASAGAGVPSVPGVGGGAGGAAGAASSGVTGIVTAVAGAVSAISSVIGNFQMAGMNKTLDLIENYTRYLKIGLVEQGDSLLNDQHVIRNTLTDFMAYNWNVQATYFQGISEKLDTIIGMGGIHTTATARTISTFSAERPAAAAELGPTINVNIDTVESDVTDLKVRNTFNRAIRMSKLAGAFPPGRFPQ